MAWVTSSYLTCPRVSTADAHMEMLAPGWNFNREHDATANPQGDRVVYALLESDTVLETRLRNLVTGAEQTLPIKASWFDWSSDGRLCGID